MALRSAHGNGSKTPRIEVLPADEQPIGVPRPALPPYPLGLGVQSFDPIGKESVDVGAEATSEYSVSGVDPDPSIPPRGGSKAKGPTAPREPSVKPAGQDNRFGKGNAYASAGGKARAARAAILRQLGPQNKETPEEFKHYQGLAESFRKQYVQELARDVGGGECGTGPALMAKFAAMQAAASQWLTERGQETGNAEDLMKAMQLQNSSRQNLMAAHEMCAKQAQAKRRTQNPHDQFAKEFE